MRQTEGRHRRSRSAACALLSACVAIALQGCGGSQGEDLANHLRPLLNAQSIQKLECNDAGADARGEKLRSCNIKYTQAGTGDSCVEILEVNAKNEPVTAPNVVRPCSRIGPE